MKWRLTLGIVPVFALLSHGATAATPEQVFSLVSPSVVVVDIFDAAGKSIGLGSGSVIAAGKVITNCHVARAGKTLQVRQTGKSFKATLQYADPERDLCQLSVPDLRSRPVMLGTAKNLRVGQRVYAIGAPEGLELTLSEGLVSSLRQVEGSQYIQTSAAISPGSSGGGLFDDQGRMVGITSFQFVEGQNLNFALPVDWIGELHRRADYAQRLVAKHELELNNRAEEFKRNEDWAGLLGFAQQWSSNEPNNPLAWQYQAISYLMQNDFENLARAAQKSISISPNFLTSWFQLGYAYHELKQYETSAQALKEFLRFDHENFYALHLLSSDYFHLGQYDNSEKSYQEELRIQPSSVSTWLLLGICYAAHGKHDKAYEGDRKDSCLCSAAHKHDYPPPLNMRSGRC